MTKLSRREFTGYSLSVAGAVMTGACSPRDSLFPSSQRRDSRDFRLALSVSPFTESVLAAGPLRDGERTARTVAEVQQMFVSHGATEIYQRIAGRRVSPQGHAEHGWERGLERAHLAKSLGLPFNPEIGIFANYADVANYQEPPDFTDYPDIKLRGDWLSLSIDEMANALRQYGSLVAEQILATGVTVNVWDIGNEVELGVAGVTPRPLNPAASYRPPDAVDPAIGRMTAKALFAMPEDERTGWCEEHLWPHLARLLSAVAHGIRDIVPSARFSTHISSASQPTPAFPLAFWGAMSAGGFLPDELGQSVWGTQGKSHGGPLDTFGFIRDTATEMQRRFSRPMFLAEFGTPSGEMPLPFAWNDAQLGYPINEIGQFEYLRDVTRWGVETGLISGIRPWAPDYHIADVWRNMSFFRGDGSAKPSLRSLVAGLNAARRRRVS